MRIIFTVLILYLSTNLHIAQTFTVIETEKLVSGDVEGFYYPKFSPDGSKIALTKINRKGLWIYNTASGEIRKISSYEGSGYRIKFSKDGTKLFFKINEYNGIKKYQSLVVYDFQKDVQERILERPDKIALSNVYFNDELVSEDVENDLKIEDVKVKSENSKIIVEKNGIKKEISPLGEGHYIWASLSPDEGKILFTLAGKGSFICDLDGKVITSLGYANAPQWSPNGKWITYMVDKDDGYKFTSSDIFIVSSDGNSKFQLTNTDKEIEMFPVWSPLGNKIAYHNLNGDVYTTRVKLAETGL